MALTLQLAKSMATRRKNPANRTPFKKSDRRSRHHDTQLAFAKEFRHAMVGKLYLTTKKQQGEVAQQLGVTRETVCRDLAEIRERWRDDTIDYIGRAMAEEITKQFRIEAELWDAWEKSKGVKRKVVHKCEDTGNGTKETHTVEKVESFGDPRYIELIQKCCEKRHRLLGLDDANRIRQLLEKLSGGLVEDIEGYGDGDEEYAEFLRQKALCAITSHHGDQPDCKVAHAAEDCQAAGLSGSQAGGPADGQA